jgi:predicted metal-dependent enzyme (double-stranded beta helix superfamily)
MSFFDASQGQHHPEDWDSKLDAVAAAPDNHAVLYEDDCIRVLSVTLQPGIAEPLHHHRFPSIFVIDRIVPLRDFDAEGREVQLPIPPQFDLPLVLQMPPQPPHSVLNVGEAAFHGTRIEFKQGFPGDAMPHDRA